MKKTLFFCISLCILLLIPTQIAAQSPPGPAKVLQIGREEVKPGKGPAHEKVEAGWPRAFAKAKWPVHYLAMTTISGPSEAWFITGYDSFAGLEEDRNNIEKTAALQGELDQLSQQDGELLSGMRGFIAVYREDLSYRPDFKLAEIRYTTVTTYRVRPGHDTDFVEGRKIVRDGYGKIESQTPRIAYQVTSGAPSGTYLVFVPMKSLKEIDVSRASMKSLQEAIGEENEKKLRKISGEAYIGTESTLFALSPKMSYVSKEFASAALDFWAPKPKPVAKAATPKPAEAAAKEGQSSAKR